MLINSGPRTLIRICVTRTILRGRKLNDNQELSQSQLKKPSGFCVTITEAIRPLFCTQTLRQFVCKELRPFLYHIHELHKKEQSKEPRYSLYSVYIYVQQ